MLSLFFLLSTFQFWPSHALRCIFLGHVTIHPSNCLRIYDHLAMLRRPLRSRDCWQIVLYRSYHLAIWILLDPTFCLLSIGLHIQCHQQICNCQNPGNYLLQIRHQKYFHHCFWKFLNRAFFPNSIILHSNCHQPIFEFRIHVADHFSIFLHSYLLQYEYICPVRAVYRFSNSHRKSFHLAKSIYLCRVPYCSCTSLCGRCHLNMFMYLYRILYWFQRSIILHILSFHRFVQHLDFQFKVEPDHYQKNRNQVLDQVPKEWDAEERLKPFANRTSFLLREHSKCQPPNCRDSPLLASVFSRSFLLSKLTTKQFCSYLPRSSWHFSALLFFQSPIDLTWLNIWLDSSHSWSYFTLITQTICSPVSVLDQTHRKIVWKIMNVNRFHHLPYIHHQDSLWWNQHPLLAASWYPHQFWLWDFRSRRHMSLGYWWMMVSTFYQILMM